MLTYWGGSDNFLVKYHFGGYPVHCVKSTKKSPPPLLALPGLLDFFYVRTWLRTALAQRRYVLCSSVFLWLFLHMRHLMHFSLADCSCSMQSQLHSWVQYLVTGTFQTGRRPLYKNASHVFLLLGGNWGCFKLACQKPELMYYLNIMDNEKVKKQWIYCLL